MEPSHGASGRFSNSSPVKYVIFLLPLQKNKPLPDESGKFMYRVARLTSEVRSYGAT